MCCHINHKQIPEWWHRPWGERTKTGHSWTSIGRSCMSPRLWHLPGRGGRYHREKRSLEEFFNSKAFPASSAAQTAQRTTGAPRALRLVNTVLSQQPDFLDFSFPLPHLKNNKKITSIWLKPLLESHRVQKEAFQPFLNGHWYPITEYPFTELD